MTRTGTCSAGELAKYLGAELHGDAATRVSGVASPERAGAGDLIYVDSAKHQERAAESRAACAIVGKGMRIAGKTLIEAGEPKLAFAKAAALLTKEDAPRPSVHATAIAGATAKIAPSAFVGPYVVIEEDVVVGEGSVIEAFCFLGRGSRVGASCRLHPRVTLYAGAKLADGVEVHSGAVIGADGFGYVFGEGRQWKFPQAGGVEIGDDVEIGANTTIDRGSLETTQVGKGVKIDNLVQVAHNVRIGEHSVLAAQTGVSGSSTLGKNVIVGGQVGIADHCTLEDGAIAGAQAGIPTGKTIHGGQVVWGTPARSLEKFKRQYAWFAQLPALVERIRKLESAVGGKAK
ncbi:MAG TPA: UDP-3-O-(3-hydroxymyristoyl)glucosamine N-acyltransferase [Candidatus Baltobacteraceae bacterium]|nr:UDP-3-O-(3-hydroxymyristoyl)glucosamine N-acyltransferase [Candidatus Baltobacteraceae bacterium]